MPSNVREGYLARLLYRRLYRLLRKVGIENKISDLVEAQIGYWGDDFPQLTKMREEILEMIKYEGEKYLGTLERGSGLVKRYLQRNKKKIPVEQLVEFYDSHGLTPDYVSEVALESGVVVETPEDFYSLVALRHLSSETRDEEITEDELISHVEGLQATRALFYQDPYLKEFEAEVMTVIDNRYVVLDQTGFYAEGGGQISDTGTLRKDEIELSVTNVDSIEGVILHEVEDASKLSKGNKIKGSINWERRQALMRAHTATHIILGAARRVLGEHAWQAGAQKGIEASRLDISHYKRLERTQIEEIEQLANRVVREGRRVICNWMQRDEAEARYGFRLYQGGVIPGKMIRVVEIEGGWDVEACGGTHLENTSEAGLIKILNTERIQDGVERLVYAVGPYALAEVQNLEKKLMKIAETLGSPLDEIVESVKKTVERTRELRKQLDNLQSSTSKQIAQKLMDVAVNVKGVKLVIHSDREPLDFFFNLGNALAEIDENTVAVMFSEKEKMLVVKVGQKAILKGAHAGKLTSTISKFIGGRGGGQPHFGQGGGGDHLKFKDSYDSIKKALKAQLD